MCAGWRVAGRGHLSGGVGNEESVPRAASVRASSQPIPCRWRWRGRTGWRRRSRRLAWTACTGSAQACPRTQCSMNEGGVVPARSIRGCHQAIVPCGRGVRERIPNRTSGQSAAGPQRPAKAPSHMTCPVNVDEAAQMMPVWLWRCSQTCCSGATGARRAHSRTPSHCSAAHSKPSTPTRARLSFPAADHSAGGSPSPCLA